jgi:hypothetical protein
MRRVAVMVLAALLAIPLASGDAAGAASGELRVDGEGTWHPKRAFGFKWEPVAPPNPNEAVFRLYDPQGQTVASFQRTLDQMLKAVSVPPVPGIYRLEAWLRNASGEEGARSTATLRFDDTAPGSPAVKGPGGWVLGVDQAMVRIGGPLDSPPLSGIRGYAISVDRGGGSSPCDLLAHCRPEEVDLAGGEGGSIALGTLPEGVSFVRAVAVSGAGVPSAIAVTPVRVDSRAPLLTLEGLPSGWSDGPVQLTAGARDETSGMAAAGPLGPFTAIAVDGAAPARSLGDTVSTWVGDSGVHRVEYFARDAAGNAGGDGVGAPGAATVRIDEDPPHVAFSTVQDAAEPERIEALVSDRLSGPSPERGWIGVRPAGTHARFEQLPTWIVGERLIAHWDSDSYPDGRYEFLATGFDAAGNVATGTGRRHGGAMVLRAPLKAQVELPTRLTRFHFRGRLREFGARPVPGQAILVTETFAAGAEPRQRTSVVRTRADGAFATRLAPGPSRAVVASFAGTRVLTRAVGESARLEVPTRLRLRASAPQARIGGAPVVFSGRVGGTGVALAGRAGLPVELQFRYRGGTWSEFRTVETGRSGRFRYRYRFSDDDSRGVRFQFRAYVKGREGWPYGPGTSRPVLVTGR